MRKTAKAALLAPAFDPKPKEKGEDMSFSNGERLAGWTDASSVTRHGFARKALGMLLAVLLLAACLPAKALAEVQIAADADRAFVASVGGSKVGDQESPVQLGAYTYTPWGGTAISLDLITVTLPTGTQAVDLSFDEGRLVYNYDGAGGYLAGAVPDDQIYSGVTSATVQVDANADGAFDFIQVQTPYDANRNSDVLFAITFAYVDGLLPTVPAKPIDVELQDSLLANIARSYGSTADPWRAMGLAALGAADGVNRSALLASSIAAMKEGVDITACQRGVLALTALGFDATRLPDGEGTYDAIARLGELVDASSATSALVSALWAYASGSHEVEQGADLTEAELIGELVGRQLDDGSFAIAGSDPDADMTAMAICALEPFASEYANAAAALEDASAALRAMQLEDGSFGTADAQGAIKSDANSTAMAVIAMCALGLDPAEEWASAQGTSPLGALLTFATSDKTGFTRDGALNDLATEQGFRALVAYEGLKSSAGAFNVYTQAARGDVGIAIETRLCGERGSGTAKAISQVVKPQGCDWVVLATSQSFADAMSSTGLAGVLEAPIVLTASKAADREAIDAINELGATHAYVIGGPAAVSDAAVNQIVASTSLESENVKRLYGETRADTSVECAVEIAKLTGSEPATAIVSTGSSFRDALSVSPYAYATGSPILLQTGATAQAKKSYYGQAKDGTRGQDLLSQVDEVLVVGGLVAVSEESVASLDSVVRLAGATGYETSNEIATYLVETGKASPEVVCIATGALSARGVDALAGSALAGKNGGVMLLVNDVASRGAINLSTIKGGEQPSSNSRYEASFLEAYASQVGKVYVLGGTAVVTDELAKTVQEMTDAVFMGALQG